MFRTLILLLCLAPLPVPAQSGFREAMELWLAGDDEISLPALAELAQSGHSNARILLGRIEITDRGLSPYRLSLSPAERRALFRQTDPARAFAKSWLAVEAGRGSFLASLLLASRKPRVSPELIEALAQIGEAEATDHPTRILALHGRQEDREALLQDGPLLDDLRPYLSYLTGPPEPRGDGLAALRHMLPARAGEVRADDPQTLGMAGLLALGWGFGDLDPANRWRRPVEDWLMAAPSTQPIRDLCDDLCADEAGACAMTLMALSGGYYEVIRLDTPTETLIPQDVFLASPRARLMTLRRAAQARDEAWGKLIPIADIARASACIAAEIDMERAR